MKNTLAVLVCAFLIGVLVGCSGRNTNPATTQSAATQSATMQPSALQPVIPQITRSTPAPTSQSDPHAAADKAWQRADHTHTEESYRRFAEEYPNDLRAKKSKAYAAQLAWQHCQKAGTSDAYEAFLAHYPEDPHAAEARKLAKGEDISITEAVRRGWVKPHISGDGLQSVSLKINRKVHRALRVSIPAGTLFLSGGNAQNMVACEDSTADLTSSTSCDLSISAACANFYLEQPDEHNTFSIQKTHPNANLRKVLAVIAKERPRSIVSQLAVWSLTDNPSREDVDGHIMPSPEMDDFRQAAHLLRAAGVSPSSRQMFQHLR